MKHISLLRVITVSLNCSIEDEVQSVVTGSPDGNVVQSVAAQFQSTVEHVVSTFYGLYGIPSLQYHLMLCLGYHHILNL